MIEKNTLGAGLAGSIADKIRGRKDERSIQNRIGYGIETSLNTHKGAAAAIATAGTAALAVDTFAGSGRTLGVLKDKLPDNIRNFLRNAKKEIIDGFKNIKTSETFKSITGWIERKLPDVTKNAKRAFDYIKNNKKVAIIAAGAAALMGVVSKFSHKQGKIDQKYDDLARIEAHNKKDDVHFE